MGQQQILLIVIGVIVVGITVAYATNLFNSNAEQSYKDNLILDSINLGLSAQQYYKKAVSMGGGGNTFKGWEIPKKLLITENGSFAKNKISRTSVILVGMPPENLEYEWHVHTVIKADNITAQIEKN